MLYTGAGIFAMNGIWISRDQIRIGRLQIHVGWRFPISAYWFKYVSSYKGMRHWITKRVIVNWGV